MNRLLLVFANPTAVTITKYSPWDRLSNSNNPYLSVTATLTREESLARCREAVADSTGWALSSVITPLILPDLVCACTAQKTKHNKPVSQQDLIFMCRLVEGSNGGISVVRCNVFARLKNG